jgi:hypothetical protein
MPRPHPRPPIVTAMSTACLLRYAWAAPASGLGLLIALLVSLVCGTRWRVVEGVVEIAPCARRWSMAPGRFARLPFAAITFGHVVLGASERDLQQLRRHEHAHVRQYERWGPLMLLAYPAASLWMLLTGRRAHADNPFEVQARLEEQR